MRTRKMIKTICNQCGKEFEKADSELKRNLTIGRKNFCSRRCTGKSNLKNLDGHHYDLSKCIHKPKLDKYSGLRRCLNSAKKRRDDTNITLDYLLEIWNKQKGVCPYTGVQLVKPFFKKANCVKSTASLDRIDSSKGYIFGNVQFISIAMNHMKGTMSDEDAKDLCRTITGYWSLPIVKL